MAWTDYNQVSLQYIQFADTDFFTPSNIKLQFSQKNKFICFIERMTWEEPSWWVGITIFARTIGEVLLKTLDYAERDDHT